MIAVVAALVFGIIVALAFVTVSRPDSRPRRAPCSHGWSGLDDRSDTLRRVLEDGRRLVAELSTATGSRAPDGPAGDVLPDVISEMHSFNSTVRSLIVDPPGTPDALGIAELAICAQQLRYALELERRLREVDDHAGQARPSTPDVGELSAALARSLDDVESRLGRC